MHAKVILIIECKKCNNPIIKMENADFSSSAFDSLLERHFLNHVVIVIATVTLRFISGHFLGDEY